jgi:4-aminobutyrate--pyruvate transaminase
MHAYTNSAHPTAAAVGLRNLRIIEEERLVENAQAMGDRLGDGLRAALGSHPHVTNIRQLGLIAGLTLAQDASLNQPYEASAGIGRQVATYLREQQGVITRFVGDQLVFAPPLVINAEQVDLIVEAVEASVRAVTDK